MAQGFSRRSLLKAAGLVTVASAPMAACASNDDTVEVFVTWSSGELDSFRKVIEKFAGETGRRVRIVPVGEQVRELLRARFNANNPPDIAVVSLPGLVMDYARDGHVLPIDAALASKIPASLNETVTIGNNLYGLWVKAAHKSIFWYRRSALAAAGFQAFPQDWPAFVELLAGGAKAGRPMLSIGAADGWVLTDWFENVLAGMKDGVTTYRALAKGDAEAWGSPVVTETLDTLAQVWTISGVFPHGPQRALLTQYEESVYEVFAECRSGMVFEGDFVSGILAHLESAGRRCEQPYEYKRFPKVTGDFPLVVGGDVAARLSDSVGGGELVAWLSKPDSMLGWVAQGGFLSPNTDVKLDRYRGRDQDLADQFHKGSPLFDLSDQLSGRLSAGQGRGMPRILIEFFRDVTRPGARKASAIETAQARLVAEARGVKG